MSELLCLGELLIDFTPAGTSEDGRLLFARNPGGAPANVAVQARRAGVSAGFLGRVGKDMFGDFLLSALKNSGVDTAGLSQDPDYATTLAFVQLSETGDRDFSFYRNPGADTRLDESAVDLSLIDQCKMLCFGSLLLTAEPSRSTVKKLVDHARETGKLTAYDPNWRPALWKDQEQGVREMESLLAKADIVKVSEEELALLTGKQDLDAGAAAVLDRGASLVAVTLGPKGCRLFTKSCSVRHSAYDVKVVDTTGSGDSFFGALLAGVIRSGKKPGELSREELTDLAGFASAAGSLCAARPGAIPAMPDSAAIEHCRDSVPLLE